MAPPIDPRLLNIAALSGTSASRFITRVDVPGLNFQQFLAKAKSSVQNLMYFGDLLSRSLYNRDNQRIERMKAELDLYVVEQLQFGGQYAGRFYF